MLYPNLDSPTRCTNDYEPRKGAAVKSQLMLDLRALEEKRLLEQAIVAFEEPVYVDWPLETIQQALGNDKTGFYTTSLALPRIYPVREGSPVVGYLISPADIAPRDLNRLFWRVLLESECAAKTDDGYDFLDEDGQPSSQALWADGLDGGQPVIAVGYQHRLALPTRAITRGIERLMGAPGWPTNRCIFPYPVPAAGGTSSDLGGLLLAPTLNDLNDHPDIVATAFRAIVEVNDSRKIRNRHPNHQMEEFDA